MKIKASFLSFFSFFSFFPLKAPGLFAALVIAAAASLDAQIIVDGFVYERNRQGAALIKYNGMAASITIPNNIEGMAVTEIGHRAFYGYTGLVNVTIPASVSYIGMFAFSGCANLSSVAIPESTAEVGAHAFSGCRNLSRVALSRKTRVGNGAFPPGAQLIYTGAAPPQPAPAPEQPPPPWLQYAGNGQGITITKYNPERG